MWFSWMWKWKLDMLGACFSPCSCSGQCFHSLPLPQHQLAQLLSLSAHSHFIWRSSSFVLKYQNEPPHTELTLLWNLFGGKNAFRLRLLQVHSTWLRNALFTPNKSTVQSAQCALMCFDIFLKMFLNQPAPDSFYQLCRESSVYFLMFMFGLIKLSLWVSCKGGVIIIIIVGHVCFNVKQLIVWQADRSPSVD